VNQAEKKRLFHIVGISIFGVMKRNQIISLLLTLIALAAIIYFYGWILAVAIVFLFWAYSLDR